MTGSIVLICGPRAAGKDMVTMLLKKHYPDWEVTSFAEQVKRDCAEMHGLDFGRLMTDRNYKEQYRLKLIEHGLQMRSLDPNHWVRKVYNKHTAAKGSRVFIVSDYRFPNEAAFLAERGLRVITIRVVASDETRRARGWVPNSLIDNDPSERALDHANCTLTISNDSNSELPSFDWSLVGTMLAPDAPAAPAEQQSGPQDRSFD